MAGSEKVVVDASVAFKWFVEEQDSSAARVLAGDYGAGRVDIASVELLPFEVLNALRYAPDSGLEDLRKAALALDKLGLDLRPLSGELAGRCVENSLRYGISVYDSAYLSLGELEGESVYTADVKLMKRVGGDVLKHISNYKTSQ
ncbi:MAG: type II toxin-antitoxin system VapC family toxin [Candidatus Bathyarchaeia archaeon]